MILESRWSTFLRQATDDDRAWLRETVDGQQVGAYVTARIDAARLRLPRDVQSAHMELERVPAVLRDARSRHGARTLDDAVSDYHEAMERLFTHAGLENAISVRSADFAIIREDVRAARTAWGAVTALHGLPAGSDATAVTATTTLLARIDKAAEQTDAAALQRATHQLKEAYFDLLAALSRPR